MRVITDDYCLICFKPAEDVGGDRRPLCREHKAELPLLCSACGERKAVVWEGRWPVCVSSECKGELRGR